jgi:hypothetical protein
MSTRLKHCRTILLLGASSLAACNSAAPAAQTDTSAAASAALTESGTPYAYERIPLDTTRAPGTVIDSVFPMPEMLHRFRQGLPRPAGFTGGASSKRELARQFVLALAAGDKPALGALALSRAEFAWIYFASVSDTVAANGMPPALRWDGLVLRSEKGIARALDRVGRKPLTLEDLDCPNPPVTSGAVTLHDGCTVRLSGTKGNQFSGKLFGAIVEHRGRYKFVSYSNDM